MDTPRKYCRAGKDELKKEINRHVRRYRKSKQDKHLKSNILSFPKKKRPSLPDLQSLSPVFSLYLASFTFIFSSLSIFWIISALNNM